jgi:hypothetical protein
MKKLLVIACLTGLALSPAEEAPTPAAPAVEAAAAASAAPHKLPFPMARIPQAPRAWLGLEITKPDETITAHLPNLPPGIGFVVRSVDEGGPAEQAGLREFDVLWKIGDQMLVNEGQLAALLRLRKPGDEINLAGFRAGKALEVTLKLGEAPAGRLRLPGELVDETILPGGCHGPMRVINVAEKLASYSTEDGRLEVRRLGNGFKVDIFGPENQTIFDGEISADGSLDQIPDAWKRRVYVLRRGLEHALEGRMLPSRQPRPRVVPPSGEKS